MKQVMQPKMLVERKSVGHKKIPDITESPKNKKTSDYSEEHKRNILKETRATKSTIQPGHIIRFNYRGVKNSKNVHEPRPLVLVLNPRYKGYMHGIALRVLSPKNIKQLAGMVRDSIADKAAKYLKLRLPRLKSNIDDPYRFYHSQLKKFISRSVKVSPYRTYITSGISALNIVDYKFESMDKKSQREVIRGEVAERKAIQMSARDKILARRERAKDIRADRRARSEVAKNNRNEAKERRANRRKKVLSLINRGKK